MPYRLTYMLGMLGKFVIAYLDDILVYSPILEAHISHVKAILVHLLKHHLSVKAEKCEFHASQFKFLGYLINAKGVHSYPL